MPLLGDSLLVTAALGAGAIAYQAWRNRPKGGTTPLAGVMVGILLWSGAHLVEHHATGVVTLGAEKLKWVGLIPVAFLWFAFVLEYTGREKFLGRRYLVVLFSWPVLLTVLLWIPESSPSPFSVWHQLESEAGLVFWTHIGLSYGLLAVGSGFLLDHVRSVPALFRRQRLAVFAGVAAAWAGSVVSVFELFGDVYFHALQVGFVVMGGFLLWAVVENDLTKIAPIARHTVIETLAAGVVVIDADRQVTSLNPAAKRILGLEADTSAVGQSVAEIFADHAVLRDRIEALERTADDWSETVQIDDRTVECELSALRDDRDRFVGGVLLLYDITDQQRQQVQLEQQNERLEKFAHIVAHDLRNPLNVASGHVALAREECDCSHLEPVERSHTRMEALIEDLLALARQGEQTVDPTTVALPAVADQCWKSVATENAAVGHVADISVEADPDRLRQLFENLFRNAVEHGGSDVTITIGELDDGFYVADDGDGIAVHEREQVFETGYSTSETGTGLGLDIVSENAAAHGWEVEVSASAAGGVRFEFTNVTSG